MRALNNLLATTSQLSAPLGARMGTVLHLASFSLKCYGALQKALHITITAYSVLLNPNSVNWEQAKYNPSQHPPTISPSIPRPSDSSPPPPPPSPHSSPHPPYTHSTPHLSPSPQNANSPPPPSTHSIHPR